MMPLVLSRGRAGYLSRPRKKKDLPERFRLALFWFCLTFIHCCLGDKVIYTNNTKKVDIKPKRRTKKKPPKFPVYTQTVKGSFLKIGTLKGVVKRLLISADKTAQKQLSL